MTLYALLLFAFALTLWGCQQESSSRSSAEAGDQFTRKALVYSGNGINITRVRQFVGLEEYIGEFSFEMPDYEYLTVEDGSHVLRIDLIDYELEGITLYEGNSKAFAEEGDFWRAKRAYLVHCSEQLDLDRLSADAKEHACAALELSSEAHKYVTAGEVLLKPVYVDALLELSEGKFAVRQDFAGLMSIRSGKIQVESEYYSYYEFGSADAEPGYMYLAVWDDKFALSYGERLKQTCAFLWDGVKLQALIQKGHGEDYRPPSRKEGEAITGDAAPEIQRLCVWLQGMLASTAYDPELPDDAHRIAAVSDIVGQLAASDMQICEWILVAELAMLTDPANLPLRLPSDTKPEKKRTERWVGDVRVGWVTEPIPDLTVDLPDDLLGAIHVAITSSGELTGSIRMIGDDHLPFHIASTNRVLGTCQNKECEDTVVFAQEVAKKLLQDGSSELPAWVRDVLAVVADRKVCVELPPEQFLAVGSSLAAQGSNTAYEAVMVGRQTDRHRIDLIALDDNARLVFRGYEHRAYLDVEIANGHVTAVQVGQEAEEVRPEMVVDAAKAYASMIEQGVLQPLPEYRGKIMALLSFLSEGREYDRIVSVTADEFVEDGYRTSYPGKEG